MPMSPRLLRPRQARGFDPRAISGIEAWWDFSDLASITLDTGVSSISDKSGLGRSATQAVGANQPLLSSAVKNGLAAASFDGVNDNLATANVSGDLAAFTTFAVLQLAGYGGGELARIWTRSDTQRAIFVNGLALNLFVAGQGAGAYRSDVNSAQLNTWYRVTASSTGGNSPTVAISVNGTANTVTLSGTNSTSSVDATPYMIGDRTAGSRQFKGLIGEILIYNRALSAAEIAAINGYISGKWAI